MNDFWVNKKLLITGGNGFLGKYVVAKLKERGVKEEDIFMPSFPKYDFRNMDDCQKAMKDRHIVIHLAGVVGGIGFNKKHPGKSFYDNAAMALNIIEAARLTGVQKFVGIGSVCEYPKFTPVPFKEESLWDGYPEETNAPYGLAKKFMLVQSQAYAKEYGLNAIHLLVSNLYGPGDDFDPKVSHVIPALIKKIADAKKQGKDLVEVWGTGKATRDFLYVEDAAKGIVLATEKYNKTDQVNLGSGIEISIKELAETICRLMDFKGSLRWNSSESDGQPRRCLDTRMAKKEFGFSPKTDFVKGLQEKIDQYIINSALR